MRGKEVKREELHRGGRLDYGREIDEFHRDSFFDPYITGNGS